MPDLVPGIFVVCLFKAEGGKTMRVENGYDWPAVIAATAITITAAAVLAFAACCVGANRPARAIACAVRQLLLQEIRATGTHTTGSTPLGEMLDISSSDFICRS